MRNGPPPLVPPPPPAPVTHGSTITSPVLNPTLTTNQRLVVMLADVMGTPPVSMGQDYLDECIQVAALLGIASDAAQATLKALQLSTTTQVLVTSVQRPLPSSPVNTNPNGNVLHPAPPASSTDSNNHVAIRNAALGVRNAVFDFINKVSAFITRALNTGLQPPDNPFALVATRQAVREQQIRTAGNSADSLFVDPNLANDLVYNIGAYVQLLAAQSSGQLDLGNVTNVSAQINSFTLSLDGYGSNGNVATDLMRFLPSADEVREQKNEELLAAFDFKRRVPKVIFTSDYQPTGDKQGMLVGWKKIPDASGYVVRRRNVFDNTEAEIHLSNSDLTTVMDHVRDYIKAYVTTFYDTVDDTQLWTYLDQSVLPDQYYLYFVKAYQVKNDSKDQVFNVPTNPSSLSAVNRGRLTSTLSGLANQYFGTNDPDSINPWPLVSLQLYGNSQFDWILAAVNSRASVNRSDSADDTRRFSYLGARISHLLDFMDRGLFVVPKNVNDVVSNVNSSISAFGVSQTIAEILHETGILYYFEGTEQKKPDGFNRAGTLDVSVSPLLSGIISVVDPETATMDLGSLGTNLPAILNNTQFSNDPAEVTGLRLSSAVSNPNVHATSQEVNVPNPDATSSTVSQSDVQYLNQLPPTASSVIDLTTFDGMSALVRTIRIFADEGPHRGGGDADTQTVIQPPAPADKIVVQPPPPGPVPSPTRVVGTVSGIRVAPPVKISPTTSGLDVNFGGRRVPVG